MKSTVAKWGNSLAVRLPKRLADELELTEGSVLDIRREGSSLVADVATKRRVPYYRLEDLIAEMDRLGPETEPETVDWGPDRGSEIIDDAYSRGKITLDDIVSGRSKDKNGSRGG